MLRVKRGSWKCRAYFTVEAAMVVPVVIGCVGMVCMLMFYMYDRCVFDENACRVLVWKSYVEGINNMDPAEAELENKHIVRGLLAYLQKEEEDRYLLGGEINTNIMLKGNHVEMKREMNYSYRTELVQETNVSCYFLNPMKTLRGIALVRDQLEKEMDNE